MKPGSAEGHAQLRLGPGWLTPADGARQPSRHRLHPRRDLPRPRHRRSNHHARRQYRMHQSAPGRDQHSHCPRRCRPLIWDGAGWHQSGGELNVPENIVLLPLPPYSPELNPMENVWEYLRANKLSGCVWDNYDAILKACAEAWNWLIGDPDRIRSIGTRDWATVNV